MPRTPEEESISSPDLSNRKRRASAIEDYLLPVPFTEFSMQPAVPRRASNHDLAVIATALPYIPGKRASDYGLDRAELIIADQGVDRISRMALQIVSRTASARAYVDPEREDELVEVLGSKFPRDLNRLRTNIRTDTSQPPVLVYSDRPGHGWWQVNQMIQRNEEFDIVDHLTTQAPQIRVEVHDVHRVETGVDLQGANTYKDQLLAETYHCSPVWIDGTKAIQVVAHLPLFVSTDQEVSPEQFFDTTFFVLEDKLVIPDDQLSAMVTQAKEHNLAQSALYGKDPIPETIFRETEKHWRQITTPLTHKRGMKNVRKHGIFVPEYRRPVQYSIRGFGQEVMQQGYGRHKDISIRIFDAAQSHKSVRTEAEVAPQIYMTIAEAEEEDREQEAFKQRWINEILPGARNWSKEAIDEAGRYLQAHRQDSVEVARDRLTAGSRLIILGTTVHPLMDDLPFKLLEELPVDFIALEIRKPDDLVRILDEQKLFGEVDLGGGRTMEMDAQEAKQIFPERFKDPAQPVHQWDGLIGRARMRGIEIVPVLSGQNWQELNRGISETIDDYMKKHPDAKGIYFSSLLHSITWPGYRNKQEARKLDSDRPFMDAFSLAKAYLSDPKVRMPAYTLKEKYPREVYSLAQFAMPKGFGVEWRNLRQAVAASGITERFALDTLADSPFEQQWYLDDPFGVQAAGGLSDEELYLATSPVNIKWGNLLDGIVVYPTESLNVSQ